jgi:hypothetical protein
MLDEARRRTLALKDFYEGSRCGPAPRLTEGGSA